jgi:hypothetical protein
MPKNPQSDGNRRNRQHRSLPVGEPAPTAAELPQWQSTKRTLFLRGHIVKHFGRTNADAQVILDALQAHAWVPFIDNPLPRTPGRSRKRHLHDVIENFNRRLDCPLLKLRRDGDRIGWEILTLTPNDTRKLFDKARPARKMRRHK